MRSILVVSCLFTALTACPAQQAKPDAPIYKLGKDIVPPRAIFTPEPEVSQEAHKRTITLIAIVAGYVGTDGQFHAAKVLRSTGDEALDAKALEQMKTWKFHPCTKGGKAVNCAIDVEGDISSISRPQIALHRPQARACPFVPRC